MDKKKLIIGGIALAAIGGGIFLALRKTNQKPVPLPGTRSDNVSQTNMPGTVGDWPPGTLMRAEGDPEVYIIDEEGYRRHATGGYFARMGFKMSDVISLPRYQVQAIPQRAALQGVSPFILP